MSVMPAKIFKLPGGTLAPGSAADVVVLDPAAQWTVRPEEFFSKSRNTPFAGRRLTGRADTDDRTGAGGLRPRSRPRRPRVRAAS